MVTLTGGVTVIVAVEDEAQLLGAGPVDVAVYTVVTAGCVYTVFDAVPNV